MMDNNVILTVLGVFLIVVVGVLGLGFAGLVTVLRTNKATLEKVYEGASPATQEIIRNIVVASLGGAEKLADAVKGLVDVLGIAEDITDGEDDTATVG